jgi:hypothetical protein
VLAQGGKPGEFLNNYDQESNCPGYVPAYADGHRHDFENEDNNFGHERTTDPDGNELMAYVMKPGTLHHKNKVKILYLGLKRLWKQTGGKHMIFGQKFRRVVLRYGANV